MRFETVDSEERERIIESAAWPNKKRSRFELEAQAMMSGDMIWIDASEVDLGTFIPGVSAVVRKRGWRPRSRGSSRNGRRGAYLWAERKEPQP